MGCFPSKDAVGSDPPTQGTAQQSSAPPQPVVEAPEQPDAEGPSTPSTIPRSASPSELGPAHSRQMSPQFDRAMSMDAFGRSNRPTFAPWTLEFSNVKARGQTTSPLASQPRLTSTLRHVLADQPKSRILVVGKKNSGKSSLINTIFKVEMPVAQGSPRERNINLEIHPENNDYLILHEGSGFEPGDAPRLQSIRDFIIYRTDPNRSAREKLHVVWICIPIFDAMSRNIGEGVEQILAMITVPVVVVFTKFDLIAPAEGGSHERASRTKAHTQYEGLGHSLFGRDVPAEIVSVNSQYRGLIFNLAVTTDKLIMGPRAASSTSARSSASRTKSRIAPVPLVWSVALRVSQDISIQASIEVGRKKYWRDLRSSQDFADQDLKACVNIIHMDIVEIWNFNDKNKYLTSTRFKERMSHIVKDLADSAGGVSSSADPRGAGENFAEWVHKPYQDSRENVRCVMGYIVDLTVILDGIFRAAADSVSVNDAKSVMKEHVRSGGRRDMIHGDIRSFVRETFEIRSRDLVLEMIIDLIKQHCVPFPKMADVE